MSDEGVPFDPTYDEDLDEVWSAASIGYDAASVSVGTRGTFTDDGETTFPSVELVVVGGGLDLTLNLTLAATRTLVDDLEAAIDEAREVHAREREDE